MAAAIAIDASVVVRYLTGDDKVQSAAATDLFRAAQDGKVNLIVPTSAIQETVYVLEKVYNFNPTDIAPKLISLLAIPNVETPDSAWAFEALQFYRTRKCDFGDALLCAFAHAEGCSVATFDKGIIKKSPQVIANTPANLLAANNPES